MSFFSKGLNKKIFLALLLLLIAVAAIAVFAASAKSDALPLQREEKEYLVNVLEVHATGEEVTLSYIGVLEPKTISEENFSALGTINKINVKMGDVVQKGQTIAVLDTAQADNQIEIAKRNMDTAKVARDRAENERKTAEDNYNAVGRVYTAQDIATAKENRDISERALVDAREEESTAQKEYDVEAKKLAVLNSELLKLQEDLAKEQGEATPNQATIDAINADITAKQAELALQQVPVAQKNAALTTAMAQRRAAETQYNTNSATYNRMSTATATPESEAARQRYETANYNAREADSAYKSAQSSYDSAVIAKEDCFLKASQSGYVVKMVGKVGGYASPLAPVLVIGSNETVVSFGVSATDVRELELGRETAVQRGEQLFAAKIVSIDKLPNETSRTYSTSVEIPLNANKFYIGETANVRISIGKLTGVWLPIAVVMNDGEDYVYIVEEGRAVKKRIKIRELSNDMVKVEGLTSGGKVISEGMKLIKSGYRVKF